MSKKPTVMVPGPRYVGMASCQIREANILPEHMRGSTRMVTDVLTAPEHVGKGHGTTLMHSICHEADKSNILLILEPKPFGHCTMPEDELMVWYMVRFGFQTIQADPLLFARMPGATPKVGLRLAPVTSAVIHRVSQ